MFLCHQYKGFNRKEVFLVLRFARGKNCFGELGWVQSCAEDARSGEPPDAFPFEPARMHHKAILDLNVMNL